MRSDPERALLEGIPDRSTYRHLLADRRYRRYFFATAVSSAGDWIGLFAILALTETIVGRGQVSRATAFAFSGVMIARILPLMLFGPVAGVFADRWDRKRTLVLTDLSRAVIMALIAFSGSFFHIFVGSLAVEIGSMLFAPAKEATLPNIVPRERLVHANQLNLTVTYGTLPLGGVLLAVFVSIAGLFSGWEFLQSRPEALAIWANAASFALSAYLFSRMDMPRRGHMERHPEEEVDAWSQLMEGFRFIATRPRIRALIAGVMAAAFAGGALFTVAKLFVTVIGSGSTAFGLLVAVTGTGLAIGLVASEPASRRFGKERVFAPGIATGGLFTIVVAFMPGIWTAAAAALVVGFGAGLAFVTGYTLLQEATEDRVRGRAFAAFNTGVRLAIFASLVIAPAIVGVIGIESGLGYHIGGVRITMMIVGVIAVGGALWSLRQQESVEEAGDENVTPPEPDPALAGGVLVSFEGGEGAGKSTQIRLLRDALTDSGHDVLVTREPGGTPLGERVRDLLLDPATTVDPRAEALLYAAARAQHAQEVIRPALEKGMVVLTDRYIDSSVAYQGIARDLGESEVEELNRWGTGGLLPDLVVLLDIEADEGLRRASEVPDRLEAEGLAFHDRVNAAFRQRAADEPFRFVVLDASRPVPEVHEQVAEAVFELLGPTGGEGAGAGRGPE
ncbi:MAG: dTMP kinase [Nitriliruptorales bacterium]